MITAFDEKTTNDRVVLMMGMIRVVVASDGRLSFPCDIISLQVHKLTMYSI